jgi:hypothetical protein
MSVLDSLGNIEPRVAHQVADLEKGLSQRLTQEAREGFLEEHNIPNETISAILAGDTPPAGIFGVGATIVGESQIYPAVFVLPGLAGGSMEPVSIWDTPAAAIVSRYTGTMPKDLFAVSIPIPTELVQITVGGELSCQGMRGTCGVEVLTSSGERAVLTAGHVATTLGSPVSVGGDTVGVVIFTDYLALHSPADIVADVAVARLDANVTVSRSRQVTGPGTAKQFDSVVSDGQYGMRQGWVRSVVTSFALRTDVGRWGEILITDRAISDPGDSGAPVYLDDDSGTVIGHVVAGAVPAYTLVQDINYILNSSRVTLV